MKKIKSFSILALIITLFTSITASAQTQDAYVYKPESHGIV